jgi:hypothetical protein
MPLQIGHAAQKLHLVGASLCSHSARHSAQWSRMSFILRRQFAQSPRFSRSAPAAKAALPSQAVAEFDQGAIGFVERLEAASAGHRLRLNSTCSRTCQSSARATRRFQPAPAVQRPAGARIHGADGGHLAQRGIARVQQRHQVGQRDIRAGGRGRRSPDCARARGRAPRAEWRSAQRFPRGFSGSRSR